MSDSLSLLMRSLYYHTFIKSNYLCDMSTEHEISFPIEDYAIQVATFEEVLGKIKQPQLKLILILRCIGYTYYEIADMVKLSESTVRRKHLRVLSLLKVKNII